MWGWGGGGGGKGGEGGEWKDPFASNETANYGQENEDLFGANAHSTGTERGNKRDNTLSAQKKKKKSERKKSIIYFDILITSVNNLCTCE